MTVPIVPGPDPDQPQYLPPISPPPPVYQQQPYAPSPQPYQPSEVPQTVKKAAVGTVTVIVVLVALFCVLPMIGCGLFAAIGSMSGH